MIFEIAVVEQPTKEEAKKGKLEKLIHEPTWYVAADESKAMMKAAQKLELDLDNERLQVLCRPFG